MAIIKSVLVGGAFALAAGASAFAQTAKTGAPAAPTTDAAATTATPPDPFEQVITARHVADFARRKKSVQSMIVAARMLQEVRFNDQEAGAEAKAPPAPGLFTPEGLYAEAEVMAKGDANLLTQIRVARSSGRGVLSSIFGKGLVRTVKEVGAQTLYAFEIQAKPGELLRIGAIGDTTIRMALRLRDKAGKLLCDEAGDYAPVCAVKPIAAVALRVEVLNQGNAATRAVILSN